MKPLAIAAVALKRFVRDRSNLFFVFIMPLGIIILIGAQFGGDQVPRMGIHLPDDAGVVGEAVVAIEIAGAMIEKFGGDSVDEMKRNYDGYLKQIKNA